MAKHVALFGLSADPPTGACGHAGIVALLAPLVDQLWVLPVYHHAFSSKQRQAPFDDRLRMCELSFASIAPNVHVLDAERTVYVAAAAAAVDGATPRVGSIDVVDALRAEHPDVHLWSLVLGA
jgi:nicotinic acid mononucleotide adenylyltransferase